ncbi:hypothetical protein MAIT1_02522 [Magnetofaba australis IT-1]|uniref:Uncharacterized protein n=1 Tax=Magnetofaba australis IT-1 TaxID=1434232 RepID=A0A1Y2K5K0_9PROT|nr:hypothetical protein MAIT1_02522 [Magnetofaba australis IT-1]
MNAKDVSRQRRAAEMIRDKQTKELVARSLKSTAVGIGRCQDHLSQVLQMFTTQNVDEQAREQIASANDICTQLLRDLSASK